MLVLVLPLPPSSTHWHLTPSHCCTRTAASHFPLALLLETPHAHLTALHLTTPHPAHYHAPYYPTTCTRCCGLAFGTCMETSSVVALALGLSADPQQRPTYAQMHPVLLNGLWSASVRADVLNQLPSPVPLATFLLQKLRPLIVEALERGAANQQQRWWRQQR